MRIGIDIDNTLTKVQEDLNKAAYKYAQELGKDVEFYENLPEDINNNGNFYKNNFKFSYEELKYFLKEIQEEITNKAKPRAGVVETIKKLKEAGHEIYIITARDSEFHDDPYMQSKEWLDKNNIKYDKLIVNARSKAPVCKSENIDIFIDDQLHNCQKVSKVGITTIRLTDDTNKYDNIINASNWQEIYSYIQQR